MCQYHLVKNCIPFLNITLCYNCHYALWSHAVTYAQLSVTLYIYIYIDAGLFCYGIQFRTPIYCLRGTPPPPDPQLPPFPCTCYPLPVAPNLCIRCASPTTLPHLCPSSGCRPAHIARVVDVPILIFALSTIDSARALTASPPSSRIDLGPARPIGPSPGARSRPPMSLSDAPSVTITALLAAFADFGLPIPQRSPATTPQLALDHAMTTLALPPRRFREFDIRLRRASERGWLLTDHHELPTWYAGVCSKVIAAGTYPGQSQDQVCSQDLYPRAGQVVFKCPACRQSHDIYARRAFLKSRLRGVAGHARMIAAVLIPMINADPNRPPRTLHQVTGMIYNWKSRGQLTPVAIDSTTSPPRPLYRIGEVMDLIWPPAATP